MQKTEVNTVKLKYGIRNNAVVSVHTLSTEEKGEKCNCTCPGCGSILIAKLGQKNQWHFAHKGTQCNIASAQQTAIHMLAKEIIYDKKKLLFPGISIDMRDYIDPAIYDLHKSRIPNHYEHKKPQIVNVDYVCLEKKLSNIVPDIIVSSKGHCCLIEIAVTSFIDEEKRRRIKDLGLPVLEIDISNLYDSGSTMEELTNAVLFNPENRKWIFNPLYNEAIKCAKDKYSEYTYPEEERINRWKSTWYG